jgi:hypothetical protein
MKGMDCKLLSLGGAEKHQSKLHGNGGGKKEIILVNCCTRMVIMR